MKTLLSIIIPVYQGERYIRTCIDIVNREWQEGVEVILLDDGSSDNSWNMAIELAARYDWLKVFHHDNKGVSATRNQGIQFANGKYVWFVDVDDIIMPMSINMILELISNENVDIYFFGYKSKLSRKFLNEFETIPDMAIGKYTSDMYNEIFWKLYSRNLVHNVGTKVYKKEMLLNAQIAFKDDLQIYEDALFCTSALQVAKSIYISHGVFYCYNLDINPSSLNHGYKGGYADGVRELFKKIQEFLEKDENYYNSYLNGMYGTIENEFLGGKYTYNSFLGFVENIRMNNQDIDEALSYSWKLKKMNKTWEYIYSGRMFSAYLNTFRDVIRGHFVSSKVANDIFDVLYLMYSMIFKRGKNGNGDGN